MKSKLLVIFITLFCLFTSMQIGAQVPPPSGDDGDIVFYFACINSDGQAVFTIYRNLTPAQSAAYCDDDGDLPPPTWGN